MKIFNLHDYYYVDDAPTVVETDFKVEMGGSTIRKQYKRVDTLFKLIVTNPDVLKMCQELDILRADDNGNRYESFYYSDTISYRGRRTDEHRAKAEIETLLFAKENLGDRIDKAKDKTVKFINKYVEDKNKRYTDYALNSIPRNLRDNVTFDDEKKLVGFEEKLLELTEEIRMLKRKKKEIEELEAKIKNEIFVCDIAPGDIYPDEVAPHVQKMVYEMAENNELFKPPSRGLRFG